ncbi:hypothetical protein DEU56DRAFT_818423 [Suillus clintonianus]|uniref:uncharacterized protein n=1 Tax=Suillus clintonianus TaxID=1904413 RepID=UPI001B86B213|nr:uncharacterized protein DEU56DRAFT_818423 [Suillus clintonianus]KAG2129020.1 hypothetical protein DEU56DRAFT_818423 [Suillus clintonianus]
MCSFVWCRILHVPDPGHSARLVLSIVLVLGSAPQHEIMSRLPSAKDSTSALRGYFMRQLLVVLDFGTSLTLTLLAWSFDMFHRIQEVNPTLVDAKSLRRMSQRCVYWGRIVRRGPPTFRYSRELPATGILLFGSQDLAKTLPWIANPSMVNRCECNRNILILWDVAC